VGQANHHNPVAILVPCHRVIASNGNLAGYAGGLAAKEFLLTLEGARVRPASPAQGSLFGEFAAAARVDERAAKL
jgi:methylated-DNA-[protein]-cysteine S-methyltransferase